ncbi:O-antigen ligase family protein [Gymnodinialimonas sp.]
MKIQIRSARSKAVTWLLVLILAGYPAAAMLVNFAGVDSTAITGPYRAFVVLLAVSLICSGMLSPLRGSLRLSLGVFLALYLCRLFYDHLFALHPDAAQALTFFLLATLIPTLAVALAIDERFSERDFAMRLYWVSLGLVAGYYLLVARGAIITGVGERASLVALNPISLGHLAATASLVGIYLALSQSGLRYKFAALLIVVLSIPILLNAGSRGPLVAFIFGVLWITVSNKKRLAQMLPVMLVAALMIPRDNLVFERLQGVTGDLDASVLIRLQLQISGINDMMEAPLIGKYFLDPEFGMGFWPHNVFIEAGMAMGVFGLALCVYIFFNLFVVLATKLSDRHILLSAAFVQAFIAAQFSGSIWGADKLFALTAVAFALARFQDREARQQRFAKMSQSTAA